MNLQANHGEEHETAQAERRSASSVFISQPPKKYWMRWQPSRATKATSSVRAYSDAPRRNKRLLLASSAITPLLVRCYFATGSLFCGQIVEKQRIKV